MEHALQAPTLHLTLVAQRGIMDVIKVSGTSRTSAVAGAIAGVFRENKHADVQAIGAGAVNQAVKAIVLARGYLAEDGFEVVCLPEFTDVDIDGKIRTAIKLIIELRYPDGSEETEEPLESEEPYESDESKESEEPE